MRENPGNTTINPLLLYIPYAPLDTSWVLRRQASVVSSYASQLLAIQGALACAARHELKSNDSYRLQLQNEDGSWRDAHERELVRDASPSANPIQP